MSRVGKAWHLLPHDPGVIERLAGQLRVSPIVAQLLVNRQLAEPDVARRFLDAPLSGLHAPDLLPGAAAAADLLLDAVRRHERICVYGDYDADGITGTAILWEALRLVGAATTEYYVPNRLEEGYGLNAEALRQIAATGVDYISIGALTHSPRAIDFSLELTNVGA